MKIRLITCSKVKDSSYLGIEAEFLKRISKFAKFEIIELNSSKFSKFPPSELVELESKLIKESLNSNYTIALDEHAKELDSISFAKLIEDIKNSTGKLDLIIGGAHGMSAELIKSCNKSVSLSKLTYTSQITRIVLIEQIYRAFTINNNIPYHKGDR